MSVPPTPPPEADRPVPAEIQFLLVVTGLVVLLAIVGLPGEDDRVAKDASEELRRSWAAHRSERPAAPPDAEPPPPGLDRPAGKR